jgi:autophagy-related protein 18
MKVNHFSFNQNDSCIALETRSGFSIYNLEPIGVRIQDILILSLIIPPSPQMRYNHIGEGIGKIQMLYCTSLLTLVGSGEQPGSSPRK